MNRKWSFLIIFLVVLLLLPMFFRKKSDFGSSYSTKPDGIAAFKALLNETGRSTSNWLEPLFTLGQGKEKVAGPFGTMVIVSSDDSIAAEDALTDWIKAGNNLLLVSKSASSRIISSFGLNIDPEALVKTEKNEEGDAGTPPLRSMQK